MLFLSPASMRKGEKTFQSSQFKSKGCKGKKMEKCFLCLCQTEEMRKCQKCDNDIFACCSEHFALHRSENHCNPFKVSHKEGIGRILEASRRIEPGELIFRETPLTIGPLHESSPMCLVCGNKKEVRGLNFNFCSG